jgi:molecular chaperone Hsp33
MLFSETNRACFDRIHSMLQESRLYSFIDQKDGFTLHFLEGQKLIHDLAIIHENKAAGFHYFRDAILSIQLMISFLKPGEGLGVYIDSEEPYFRLKVEMSEQGQMRTLLFPEDLNLFPQVIKNGKCRVVKTLPNEMAPYTSIINIENLNFTEVINSILNTSYQFNSQVFLSQESDQSVMLLKLPSININKIQTTYTLSLDEYWKKINQHIQKLFSTHTFEYSVIQKSIEELGFLYLGSKEIKFKCHCSRERMVHNIWTLIKSNGIEHVFAQDESSIDIKCDYCKMNYILKKDEFLN